MAENITEVLMPLMGEGVNEATLIKWLKQTGDQVRKDEPLLEVSTDKVDTEIPSPTDGYLIGITAEEGATVSVHQTLAFIADDKTATPPTRELASAPQPTANKNPAATGSPNQAQVTMPGPGTHHYAAAQVPSMQVAAYSGPKRSSPLVRKMARSQGIDLNLVSGSGHHGRITKSDILAFIANPPNISAPVASQGTSVARLDTQLVNGQETLDGVAVKREPMSKMRRLIAEHMVSSVRTSPHVTTVFEIDLHRVYAFRQAEQARFLEQEGFKLTFTPFFIHAAIQSIKEHPLVNCSVDGFEILHKDQINIGCAVALESGLIVPVIKDAASLSLFDVARRLNDLVTRARNKKLSPDDVKGGTFSITNPGGYGCITSNPIINQPQVAILGIGAIVKRPVVLENDEIKVRPTMLVSLTFDHRVIDGEGGAKYLASFKKHLENCEH